MAVLKDNRYDGISYYGVQCYSIMAILCVVACSILGLFKRFRANIDVHKNRLLRKNQELPTINISGVYRTSIDHYTYQSTLQETTPKKLTPSMVKLNKKENEVSKIISPKAPASPPVPKIDTVPPIINSVRPPATTHNAVPPLPTPVITSDAFVDSLDAKKGNNSESTKSQPNTILNKKQQNKDNKAKERNEKKLEKERLKEEQRKEKQKIKEKKIQLQKGNNAMNKVKAKSRDEFPTDPKNSCTSSSSAPPPYTEIPTGPQPQNLIQSQGDKSGNVSFAQPANAFSSNWDLVSQHRQNIRRPAQQPNSLRDFKTTIDVKPSLEYSVNKNAYGTKIKVMNDEDIGSVNV